jgi:hypothetical protein
MADLQISATDIAASIAKGLEGYKPDYDKQTVGRVSESVSH